LYSVVIPAYNAELYIRNCILSIVHQSYPPVAIIVIDDCSTDCTAEIVKSLMKIVPNLGLSTLNTNQGPNAARNFGLKLVKSDFVAFCDADDYWDTFKAEHQINFFLKNPAGLIYCSCYVVDSFGQKISDLLPRRNSELGKFELDFQELLSGNKVYGGASGVIIQKSVFDHVGFFDERLRGHEDWDMWLRVAEFYKLRYCEESVIYIRKHGHNAQNNKQFMLHQDFLFRQKWASRVKSKKAILHWRWAVHTNYHSLSSLKQLIEKSNYHYKKIICTFDIGPFMIPNTSLKLYSLFQKVFPQLLRVFPSILICLLQKSGHKKTICFKRLNSRLLLLKSAVSFIMMGKV